MVTSSVSKKEVKQILGGFSKPNKDIVCHSCGSSCTREKNS